MSGLSYIQELDDDQSNYVSNDGSRRLKSGRSEDERKTKKHKS